MDIQVSRMACYWGGLCLTVNWDWWWWWSVPNKHHIKTVEFLSPRITSPWRNYVICVYHVMFGKFNRYISFSFINSANTQLKANLTFFQSLKYNKAVNWNSAGAKHDSESWKKEHFLSVIFYCVAFRLKFCYFVLGKRVTLCFLVFLER